MTEQPLEVATWPLVAATLDPNEEEPTALGPLLPCPICGAPGACDYDNDGRPLLHTTA